MDVHFDQNGMSYHLLSVYNTLVGFFKLTKYLVQMSSNLFFYDVSLNAFCLLSKMFSLWFQTLMDAFHMHLELIYHHSESIQKGFFMFYVHSGCSKIIQNILCILEVNEQFRKCLERILEQFWLFAMRLVA